MHDVPLACLPNQLDVDRLEMFGLGMDDVPLGRGRQGNAQVPLQALEAIERHPATVLQQGNDTPRRRVVLRRAHALRRLGRKHLAAKVAPQLLESVHLRRDGRLAGDPHQHPGLSHLVDRTLPAIRAGIARSQRRVGHLNLFGAVVGISAVAAVTFGRRRRIVVRGRFRGTHAGRVGRLAFLARRRSLRIRPAANHGLRLLGACAEEHLPQPGDARILVLEQIRQVDVRQEYRPDRIAVFVVELLRLGTAQDVFQFVHRQLEDRRLRAHHNPGDGTPPNTTLCRNQPGTSWLGRLGPWLVIGKA